MQDSKAAIHDDLRKLMKIGITCCPTYGGSACVTISRACRFVHREIPAPHVILVLRLLHRTTILAMAACAFSPLPQRVLQAFLPPQPLYPPSRPLGPLNSHMSWYNWRGSGQKGSKISGNARNQAESMALLPCWVFACGYKMAQESQEQSWPIKQH